ncbi:MAG TPA: HAD family hydrolase [Mycobacteriales bacterium]|nr:HAD family hydrolase [Mycobacteriales bacterium]
MTIDTVIFDWGGTLTPWYTIDHRLAWRSYLGRLAEVDGAVGADPDVLIGRLTAAEDAAWRRSRDEQQSCTLERILRAAGVAVHEPALEAYYAAWEPHTYTDPDVPPLFRGLRERDIRIGVLSNTLWSRASHERWFGRDGVLDLIDGAVYSCEIPWTKPHPEAFRAALAAVGVADPARAVYVGDRLYDDVHGAVSMGMRAIHVPHSDIPEHERGSVQGTPDAVVRRLVDVLAVVDRWRF